MVYIGFLIDFANNVSWDIRRFFHIFGGMCMATALTGTMLGSVVGAALHSGLSEEALHSWGWRLPFLCGVFVGIIGLRIQHAVDDSPEFLAMKAAGRVALAVLRAGSRALTAGRTACFVFKDRIEY